MLSPVCFCFSSMDNFVEELLTEWQLPDLIDSFKGENTEIIVVRVYHWWYFSLPLVVHRVVSPQKRRIHNLSEIQYCYTTSDSSSDQTIH